MANVYATEGLNTGFDLNFQIGTGGHCDRAFKGWHRRDDYEKVHAEIFANKKSRMVTIADINRYPMLVSDAINEVKSVVRKRVKIEFFKLRKVGSYRNFGDMIEVSASGSVLSIVVKGGVTSFEVNGVKTRKPVIDFKRAIKSPK